ncbi:hypothetical protein B0T19DRAFT_421543 [Cercophora scortea]|uniref:LPXTG-domain-containing protein n=1 Tax=Cercophora scortea TaxID=314031 RepID=A0AAE0ILX7_9PEZI|nr:hypothetical protein B0T19DRAFT_421543 [Cercophora scortea]
MAPPFTSPTRSLRLTLLSLFLISHLASALQVTPNSPCASVCVDAPGLDISDPNSSTTKNSDIVCKDAQFDSPKGTKWKDCMTCLQNSTFSQGKESDQMWFLYNLRYTVSYCLFAFPNATDVEDSPCRTSTACGPLKDSMQHDVLQPSNMTTYSYCSMSGGEATHKIDYDKCLPCISAEGTTTYLANYFVALEAGCQQQPALGKTIALNDTVFSSYVISIVDPLTLLKYDDPKPPMPATTIIGIVVATIAGMLIISAIVFVCHRKRKNRRDRANAELFRHQSNLSFQCQTHMKSPRFWPGNDEPLSAVDEMGVAESPVQFLDDPSRRSSMWKSPATGDKFWDSPYHHDSPASQFSHGDQSAILPRKGGIASVPLHHIRTSIPQMPPSAYTSPSAGTYFSPLDFQTPTSAESTRSTSALLPAHRPYIPAEHGVHGSPQPQGVNPFASPVSAATASPQLRSYGWADQKQPQPGRLSVSVPVASSPKTSRLSVAKKDIKPTGSPVESWQIQTAFAAPPKR